MFTLSNGYTYSLIKFPGGELQPRIESPFTKDYAGISGNITSSDDLMEFILLVDALRRFRVTKIKASIYYLPYARQDRVSYPGEPLSIKVICDLINSLNLEKVVIWDVHSDVPLALLNNVQNVEQWTFVQRIPRRDYVLVSPDAGAMKKAFKSATNLGYPLVVAEKIRNTQTGAITNTVVHSEHIGDKDFLIVDDIADGGRTFLELAKVLRPLTNGKIHLYVTHGIFSKGLEVFDGLIDKIYTPNPFPNVDVNNPLLEII